MLVEFDMSGATADLGKREEEERGAGFPHKGILDFTSQLYGRLLDVILAFHEDLWTAGSEMPISQSGVPCDLLE